MRRPGKAMVGLALLMGPVYLLYVFLWEDLGDSLHMTSRHRLLPNKELLMMHMVLKVSPNVTTEHARSGGKRSEVKAGDRHPQGVDNEAEDGGDATVEAQINDEAQARERAWQYCGRPQDITKGEEGRAPPDYKLEHVTAVIRHGDRSPMYALPGYEAPWIPCDVSTQVAREDPLVRGYLTKMKTMWHNLAPESQARRFGLYPHSRFCEGAQLTGRGALQHLANGAHLRQAYIDRSQLVTADRLVPGEVTVISTEYQRTYQSAIALLYGFLPALDIGRVPVTLSRSVTFCSRRLTGLTCDCPMAYRLEAVVKKEYMKRTRNSTLHSSVRQSISSVLGVPEVKLPWLSALSDVFNGHTCHGLSLPCSRVRPSSCITWPLMGQLWRYLDYNGASQLRSYAYQRQQRLLMHPLLHAILRRMQNVTLGLEPSRFVLYSGHDKTITPLATSLGLHDGRWPRYASRLLLELYSKADPRTVYYIRVVLNGEDKTRQVRFCRGKTIDGLCPLSYFQNFVLHEDLQYFGKTSYREACQL